MESKHTPVLRGNMTTATGIYLQHYLESLGSLPDELKRNFQQLRDLDERTHSIMKEIDMASSEFLPIAAKVSHKKRREQAEKIQKLYNKAKEYGDDKVQLAIQTYELVDKHIRKLDTDLVRFESDMKNSSQNAAASSAPQLVVEPSTRTRGRRNREEVDGKKVKSAPPNAIRKRNVSATATSGDGTTGNDIIEDMPVDPNEPVYCICQQVSYGEMIGCDDNNCTIEWFHIGCMGLSAIPRGQWFCPMCETVRQKKST